MRNGRKLRQEFSTQNDIDYYQGQAKFLSALRRRPAFFRTKYFAERYGAQARANLDRLLALIAADGTRRSENQVPEVTRPYLSSKRTMSSSSM